MFYSEATDFLKALGIIGIFLVVGIVLAIIGIQHEHLTKLRDRKAELEVMNEDLKKKNIELEQTLKNQNVEHQFEIESLNKKNEMLEKELCKYDKKRKKAEKKEKSREEKAEKNMV